MTATVSQQTGRSALTECLEQSPCDHGEGDPTRGPELLENHVGRYFERYVGDEKDFSDVSYTLLHLVEEDKVEPT